MPIISKEFTVKLVITSRCLFLLFYWKIRVLVNIWQLRALKSPQKFRTSSSANFLGSWYISGLKSKYYYKIWTLWSQIGLQMIQFYSFLIMKCYKIETYHVIFKHCVQEMIILLESLKSFRKVQISFLRCSITTKASFIKGKMI